MKINSRAILEFFSFYLHLDFCSYKIGNVRTKVRLGVKGKATHCLSKENTLINKQRQTVHPIQTKP